MRPAKTQISLCIHPCSLIRIFTVRIKKAWVLSYPLSAQRGLIRLGDAQADLSVCWTHRSFCWFYHVAANFIFRNFIPRINFLTWNKFYPKNQFSHLECTNSHLFPLRRTIKNMSRDMTKPTKYLCALRRLRSAWTSAQSDQSLRCPHEESLGP